MDIGQKIKELRTDRHLEQKELADLLNVSPKTISSWEVGRTEPKMEMIEKMCKVLVCSKSDFLDEPNADLWVLSDNEKILIENYRKADEIGKSTIDRLLRYSELIGGMMNGKSAET